MTPFTVSQIEALRRLARLEAGRAAAASVSSSWCVSCSGNGTVMAVIRRPTGAVVGYRQEPCPTCLGVTS